jgi:hypothetical protein
LIVREAVLALSLLCAATLGASTVQALDAPYVEVVYDLADTTFEASGTAVVPTSFSGSLTINFTSNGAGIIDGPGELVDFRFMIEDLTVPSFGLSIDGLVDQVQTNVATGIVAGNELTGDAGQTIDVDGALGSGIYGCTPIGPCGFAGLGGPFPIPLSGLKQYPVGGSVLIFTNLGGASGLTGSLVLPIGGTSISVSLVGTEVSRQVVPEPGQGLLALASAATLAILRRKRD